MLDNNLLSEEREKKPTESILEEWSPRLAGNFVPCIATGP